ncbi:MAG: YitT family protein [Oscillospiraceae bacterium]|nr:YitT family protein [Oscillospiraceae bacterium]
MNNNLREQAIIFIKVILGGAILALGIQFFFVPSSLVTGGASGLAIIFHHITGLPTGVLLFLINLPVFLVALKALGLRFVLTALLGILVTSALVDGLALLNFTVTYDLILVSIFGGVLVGAGVGLLLAAGSSGGATDILARLIHMRRPQMGLAVLILIIDTSIIITGAFVFRNLDLTLYGIIAAFVIKQVIDAILRWDAAKKSATEEATS